MRRLLITTSLVGLISLSLFRAQSFAQYRFDNWTTDEGLPQNSVSAILQTRDGYLWLTTAAGASPYGLLHMAGNVQEWTLSLWGEGPKTSFPYSYDATDGREDLSANENIGRVVRGGSWKHQLQGIRCAYRNGNPPNIPGAYVGFRVAKVA